METSQKLEGSSSLKKKKIVSFSPNLSPGQWLYRLYLCMTAFQLTMVCIIILISDFPISPFAVVNSVKLDVP